MSIDDADDDDSIMFAQTVAILPERCFDPSYFKFIPLLPVSFGSEPAGAAQHKAKAISG